jgi:hypothetical protein
MQGNGPRINILSVESDRDTLKHSAAAISIEPPYSFDYFDASYYTKMSETLTTAPILEQDYQQGCRYIKKDQILSVACRHIKSIPQSRSNHHFE